MRAIQAMVLLLAFGFAQEYAVAQVPDPLKPWQGWVLRGEEFRDCPFLATLDPGRRESHRCAWPGALNLALTANGGQFRQSWQVYSESWIALPGNIEHWPRDVGIDGRTAPVVTRDGFPQLLVSPGTHVVTGTFAWATRPEVLPVATQTAIVQLVLDGRAVTQPERPNGAVWLGQRRSAVEREQLQISVYRLLRDDIPARLATHLRFQVSGAGREVVLPRVLPDGFVPLALEGDLPARLESDGRLRVQLRPGNFKLTLEARAASVATSITRPVSAAPWPEEEVWSFQGNDRLRVAAAEGAESIDPAQAEVPDDWKALPAYRMAARGQLNIVERSRALANVDDNQLQLHRDLWLDFDHQGYTVKDQLTGRLNRDRRLDVSKPYLLGSANTNEETLLVTVGANNTSGVELRNQNLNLGTTARVQGGPGSMPATGWSTRFDNVRGTLHLPPGHRLLGVVGADDAPGSWLDRWGLWNLFGVLIVVVFTYWVAGSTVAVVAALALLLIYQELPWITWLWANILAAIAIYRAAPEGRLRRFAGYYRCVAFVMLGVVLLPLLVSQLRLAVYPDLAVNEGRVSRPMNVVIDFKENSSRDREVKLDMSIPISPPMPEESDPDTNPISSITGEQLRRAGTVSVADDLVRNSLSSVSSRYAAGTLLQTGPGVPNWNYNDYNFSWSGPVEPSQKLHFVYVGPVLLGIWRFVAVLLSALFTLLLARTAFNLRLNLPGLPPLRSSGAAVVLAALALFVQPQPASAQAFPSQEMLDDLKARLTAPPACRNGCAEIMAADVNADGDRLQILLEASALAQVAVALPHAGDHWQLDSVQVDGRPAMFAVREGDNSLWLPLSPGAHRIALSGRLADAESVQLNFPQPPRTIRVSSRGWDSSGVTNGRLLAGSVEFTRRRVAGSAAATLAPSEFAPFVQVTRTFQLDLDWGITTEVQRVAPKAAPLQVEVPLVTGESVLTDGMELHDGRMVVGLARGENALSWQSRLERGDSITLSVPADAARSEQWIFAANPQWHLEFAGFPASLPEQSELNGWSWRYYPRAGESLTVKVTRPAAAPGSTFAIDSVRHESQFGKRSLNGSLALSYRSTQGGRQTITLPEAARVTLVVADGQNVPVRPDKGKLSLSLLPGEHTINIHWTAPRGAGLATRPDRIDLGSAASNITTTVRLPADRWTLFVHGPGIGTTLLYWGELLIFALVAAGLTLLPRSPLRFHSWLLLGLGLSTLSWWVFAGVAAWLIIMRWRRDWHHEAMNRWRFNAVQLSLAALTVVAVASLVFSGVRYGLLAEPDMGIAGPGSYGAFEWFLDHSVSLLPEPVIISLPMWVYRLLMFAWALWIALALSRWLRNAWHAWTKGGMWRSEITS
ncbi:MAG: hypothetical protein ABI645_13825 [Pseudomonadota bacterium]